MDIYFPSDPRWNHDSISKCMRLDIGVGILQQACNKPARWAMPPPPPPNHQHLQARGQPEVTYLTLANQRLSCSQNTDTAMQSGHTNHNCAFKSTSISVNLGPIQWYQTREVFFGFSVCSHVYLLNYRSELAQIWRQDTGTIHDHNHTKKIYFNARAARNNGP